VHVLVPTVTGPPIMPRRVALLAATALQLITMPQMASTQQPGASRVPVRVYVSVSDSATRFFPVRGHRLVFYRSANDTIVAVTDSIGALTIALLPGDYRLVSAKPFPWRGADYSWNVPIVVRPGMPIIDLRAPDADRPTVLPAAALPAPSHDSSADYRSPDVYRKDPAIAGALSFLVPGIGSLYVGETGRGLIYFTLATGGAMVAIAGMAEHASCQQSFVATDCANKGGTLTALGALTAIGAWFASIADAAGGAKRYNARHAVALRLEPGAQGTTRIGLSLTR
jgi:hypothetical protein